MDTDTIHIETPTNLNLDFIKIQKMAFVYNAIESGWSVKKNDDKYIFSKKHEGKKEVYLESYLRKFIEANMDINKMM
jgi:hypothetical protein